jgi:hypothetical protein
MSNTQTRGRDGQTIRVRTFYPQTGPKDHWYHLLHNAAKSVEWNLFPWEITSFPAQELIPSPQGEDVGANAHPPEGRGGDDTT